MYGERRIEWTLVGLVIVAVGNFLTIIGFGLFKEVNKPSDARSSPAQEDEDENPHRGTFPRFAFLAGLFLFVATIAIAAFTLGMAVDVNSRLDDMVDAMAAPAPAEEVVTTTEIAFAKEAGSKMTLLGPNVCVDKKPKHADADAEDNYFANVQCLQDNVAQTLEQVIAGGIAESRRRRINVLIFLRFAGPPVPTTARMHSTPQNRVNVL